MCEASHMATNIELDGALLTKAMILGDLKTKKQTVHEALSEFVQRREQAKILELFGSIDYDADFDYKRQKVRQRSETIQEAIERTFGGGITPAKSGATSTVPMPA